MLIVQVSLVGLLLLVNASFAQDCARHGLVAKNISESLMDDVSAKICSHQDDFYNTTHQCSYEVRSPSASSCTVIATNNLQNCGKRSFSNGTLCGEADACGLYVNVAVDRQFSMHIVNINIASERAASVSLRYSVYPQNPADNELYDRCVDFMLRDAASREDPVFFDCPMSRIENIGTRFLLSYLVDRQYGQILLKILSGMELAKGVIPFYIHVMSNEDGTLSLRRSKLTVTFQAYLDTAFAGASQLLYKIDLYSKECGSCDWVLHSVAVANISDPASYIDRWRNLYTVEVGSSLSSGTYRLTVLPVCSDNEQAFLSNFNYSLEFSIAVRTMSAGEIAGLCVGIAILVVALCQLVYFAYMLNLFMRRRTTINSFRKKTLYIIYKDVSKEHTTKVSALRQFLIKHMNVTVWMDRHDMILTRELDPHSWSAKCVGSADYIAVVVPPSTTNNDDYKPLYPLNFKMGCEQLDMRLKSLLSTKNASANKLCTIVSLPGSQMSQLPGKLRLYKRFALPIESTKFEYYIWQEELKMTQLDLCFNLGLVPWFTGASDAKYEKQFDDIVAELQRRPDSVLIPVEGLRRDIPAEDTSEDDYEGAEDDLGFTFYKAVENDSDSSSDCDAKEELVIGSHVIRQPSSFRNCDFQQ